jgi:hypothetical protein
MMVVLAQEQEDLLRQMAADVDMEPETLLVHLVSDRLVPHRLDLWRT